MRALSKEFSIAPSTISRWMAKFRAGGIDELLNDKARSGRPKGSYKLDRRNLLEQIAKTRPQGEAFWCASTVEEAVYVKESVAFLSIPVLGVTTALLLLVHSSM
ncbi:MAG: helix-turn-helix domain-containing protein [Deltaproteobacteria bacterium]|nr:helix-turn-helix domain-containing protein [Deltaproteobacteria bacterium]